MLARTLCAAAVALAIGMLPTESAAQGAPVDEPASDADGAAPPDGEADGDARGDAGDDPDAPPASPAQSLFDRGLEDMLDGKYETGCPALEESYRIDPLPGALFTVAECNNKWGKLSKAQTQYRDYINRVSRMSEDAQAEQGGRVDVAKEQADALEARLPKLTIQAPADLPQGSVIERNGERVVAASYGLPIPLDPGEQLLVLRAPGHEDSQQRIVLGEGARETVTLKLGRSTHEDGTSGDGMRTAAYIAGGVGVAGLLVGAIAGGVALGKAGTIDDECDDANACSQAGLDAVDSGQAAGTASTVGFIIGAVGIAAGVTLFVLAPVDDEQPDDAHAARGTMRSLGPELRVMAQCGPSLAGMSLELTW